MGWNRGYTIFEETVIGTYDLGKLDKDMLVVLMEPYRDSDIDSGGSCDLKSKDGKSVEEIVVVTWGLELPEPPQEAYSHKSDAWGEYYEAVFEQFTIVTDYFGWL